MHIPTEDKLFDHNCQFKDMKISAFNPRSLTYYCQICGGKLTIEKDRSEWEKIFGEPLNFELNKRVLEIILNEKESESKKEEEEIKRKEEEARHRAEEVKKKQEEARRIEEEEKRKKLEEEEKALAQVDPENEKAGDSENKDSDG